MHGNGLGTEHELKEKINKMRMVNFAEKYVIKDKLVGVHQNLTNLLQQSNF